MRGYDSHENPANFWAVRVHYTADPDKDLFHADAARAARAQAWIDGHRRQYPDPNDFDREFEISFFAGQGSRVFPQFTTANHTARLPFNPRRIIYRGFDFGWHCPLALFAQIDAQGRLCILREIVGAQMTTQSFAGKVVQRSAEWFPNHPGGFDDFCDPAGQQVHAIENERSEKRDIEILAGLGIHARYQWGWSRKDGRSLIHQLLALRADGTPSLTVDERECPLLVQAFLGRYIYPERKDGTHDDEPDDKTHPWADLMAALRYLVIGLHPKLGLARYAMARPSPIVDMPSPTSVGYGMPRRG